MEFACCDTFEDKNELDNKVVVEPDADEFKPTQRQMAGVSFGNEAARVSFDNQGNKSITVSHRQSWVGDQEQIGMEQDKRPASPSSVQQQTS